MVFPSSETIPNLTTTTHTGTWDFISNLSGGSAYISNASINTLTGSSAYFNALTGINTYWNSVLSNNYTGSTASLVNEFVNNLITQCHTGVNEFLANITTSNLTGTYAYLSQITGSSAFFAGLTALNTLGGNGTFDQLILPGGVNVGSDLGTMASNIGGLQGDVNSINSSIGGINTEIGLINTNLTVLNTLTACLTFAGGAYGISCNSASIAAGLSAGSASIGGALSAGSASVGGALSAGSASIGGALSAASASINGAISSLSASFQGYQVVDAEANVLMNMDENAFDIYPNAIEGGEGMPLLNVGLDPSMTLNCTGYFPVGIQCATGYFTNLVATTLTASGLSFPSNQNIPNLTTSVITGTSAFITAAVITAMTGSKLYANSMSGGSVYVYSITGNSAHFGAYTGGKMTLNGLIYTTATGGNEYLNSISGSVAYFTNLYGNLQPSNLGGVYIASTYNNLIFDTNANTSSSYWNVSGNTVEGGDSLFRIYNNISGSPEVEVMGTSDSTSISTGALVCNGGLGIAKTIHANAYSGAHGYFTNLTGVNSWLTNMNVTNGTFGSCTGTNSFLTNLTTTTITGTSSYMTSITGTNAYITSITGKYLSDKAVANNYAILRNQAAIANR